VPLVFVECAGGPGIPDIYHASLTGNSGGTPATITNTGVSGATMWAYGVLILLICVMTSTTMSRLIHQGQAACYALRKLSIISSFKFGKCSSCYRRPKRLFPLTQPCFARELLRQVCPESSRSLER